MKLHLGCGNEVLDGWINHDIAPLPGVSVVHDLRNLPWPFEDNSFEEIRMHHVLEHLPDTVATLEELHRVSTDGAQIHVRVPYWNARDMATDPTHVVAFSEQSFDYFDPSKRHHADRPYYSTARFRIVRRTYYVKVRGYRPVTSPLWQRFLEALAAHFCGVIWVMDIEMEAMK